MLCGDEHARDHEVAAAGDGAVEPVVSVLQRYISYVAARVDGLGGDSSAVLPSPTRRPGGPGRPRRRAALHGKVCEVLFDCFGDFEGFVLSDCEEQRTFRSRERGIGELVLRACAERLVVCVYTSRDDCERICRTRFGAEGGPSAKRR